jgi:hypothetical protein
MSNKHTNHRKHQHLRSSEEDVSVQEARSQQERECSIEGVQKPEQSASCKVMGLSHPMKSIPWSYGLFQSKARSYIEEVSEMVHECLELSKTSRRLTTGFLCLWKVKMKGSENSIQAEKSSMSWETEAEE